MRSESRQPAGLDRQFAHPQRLLGRLAGHAMALEHRALHRAVVDRLELTSRDRVLEVGFGPGTAVRLAARTAGQVCGVDLSQDMVRQAVRRNRRAVREGRVELQEGTASNLPFPDGSFTVAFEVNSFHHWDDPIQGVREIWRVLGAGGRAMFVLRAGHGHAIAAEVEAIVRLLTAQGFAVAATEQHHFEHGGAFVLARKP